MSKIQQRVGVWLIGGCGGVGSTVALGLAAMAGKRAGTTGLVTALPPFSACDLVDPRHIVLGGHDVRNRSMLDTVWELHRESRVFDRELIESCAPALRRAQREIRLGIVLGASEAVRALSDTGRVRRALTVESAVGIVREDLVRFARKHRLGHTIVVNVATTEPPTVHRRWHDSGAALEKHVHGRGANTLPTSSIYALAAIECGCSYINFTPSAGVRIKAIEQLARDQGILYTGRDGKTGETLLKSVLAPMFAMRHLKIRGWVGHNILGNLDGKTLDDPAIKVSKIESKERVISQITGDRPTVRTSIEYVPSMADWKVAWDFVHFTGFLGTDMSLQFTWTGCDSILAAPLVIDLVRLTELEKRRGGAGAMRHLGFFFKDPEKGAPNSLFDQWQMLVSHVQGGRSTGEV